MNLNALFGQVIPLYSQVNFWMTVAVTLIVWYAASVGLAHALFGAGRRKAVEAAKQGMLLALLLLGVGLACAAYFLFKPADLMYMIAVSVTFLLLALIVAAVFGRLGVEK